jgi:peptidoglycan/LPS O-acetylase OafA/YrhL
VPSRNATAGRSAPGKDLRRDIRRAHSIGTRGLFADAPGARAPQTRTVRSGFRTDIQGLRAIAVALVVLYHAGVPGLTGGYVGVDVFFVISGFLITGHLLASLRENGRIDFARFYARRARRILPASFVVLALTVVGAFVLLSPLRLSAVLGDAIATALYVPNMAFAVAQTDYLADTAPSPFQHYWSLGVEEQFYLLWPVLLLGMFLLCGRSSRRLVVGLAVVVALSFAACLVLTPVSQPWAFFSLPARAWELAAGGLVACGVGAARALPERLAATGGWLGLALIVTSAFIFTPSTPYPSFPAALPVLGAAMLVWCGARPSAWGPDRLLRLAPLQWLGAISYSLYLVHWPLLVLVHERVGLDTSLPLWATLGLAAASVLLAWALYRWVEVPMRDGRRPRLWRPRVTLFVTAATSLVLAGSLVVALPAVALLPEDAGRPAVTTALTPLPQGTDFVPSNLTPTLSGAAADTGAIYTDGCQQGLSGSAVLSCSFGDLDSPRVMALFGDSHAGRWFPALEIVAKNAGIRLVTYTKSGCRSEEEASLWERSANPSCSAWRDGVLAALHEHPPDVIVLTNHLGPSPARSEATTVERWTAAISSTIDRMPAASRVVTIADTPQFPAAPQPCLSSHLDHAATCAVPRDRALNPGIAGAQRAVSELRSTGYLDLNDYLCNENDCPPIIGRTLAYSDEHHMTATMSERLAVPLATAIAPYLRH